MCVDVDSGGVGCTFTKLSHPTDGYGLLSFKSLQYCQQRFVLFGLQVFCLLDKLTPKSSILLDATLNSIVF